MITDALRDFLRYVPSRIIPAVAAVAAVPFLTRLLSPGEYGRYTLALAGVTFFTAISSSWITTSAIRFVPAYTQDGRLPRGIGLLVGMFLITISGSSLVAGAGALVLAGRAAVPTVYGAVALLLCAATATHEFLLGLLRSRRRATTFTTLTAVAGTAGYALAVALAALVEPSASAVIAGFLLAVVLVLPFTARRALAGVRPSFSGIPRADVREVLQYGLPALLINGLTWVTVLSDRYVLAALQGEQAVGIYAASRDLSDKMLVVLNTLFLLASTPVTSWWPLPGTTCSSPPRWRWA
jgi:O-antigen/teichoic acid export membrane protein